VSDAEWLKDGPEEPGLELLTMGAIVHPVTGTRNPLASRNDRGMADDGDQFAVASCLDPDDAKAILVILVGDALHQPGKHLTIRWLRVGLHGLHSIGPVGRALVFGAEGRRNR
jgi:hypothetical protein